MPAVPQSHEIAAGVLAGVADAIACHPIDQVKTQFHVNPGRNGSMLAAIAEQARSGGVTRIYRGLLAACLRPQALCMYAGNEWAKRVVAGAGELTTRTAPVAGFLTGYLESALVTPFELVKVRMQVKEHVGRYSSSASCARAVINSEGLPALYRGFGATCARNCTFNGVYFGLIFAGQAALPPRPTLGADIAQNLALGAAAGACATLIKAPFDVVKSRIQAQLAEGGSGALRYRHTAQAVALVAKEEGVAALWKGLGPMTVRCTLGFSISFAAFDAALAALGNPRGARTAAAREAEALLHEE